MSDRSAASTKKRPVVKKKLSRSQRWYKVFLRPYEKLHRRIGTFLVRRPHRSFRRTRRRDYVRSFALPGYFAFTIEVWRLLWRYKKLFGLLVLFYAVISGVFVGISLQSTYAEMSDLLQQTGADILTGAWGEIGKASLLLISAIGGSFAPQLTDAQQVYSVLIVLVTWLTTVWLIRAILSGHTPRLREGIYNSGSPIVPTFLVLVLLFFQLAPFALAALGVSVAFATDFLSNGIIGMIFWLVVGLLTVLSLYWISGTILALIIVTLPGMYPMQAVRAAGDLVVGRRLRILLRFVWLALLVGIGWIVIMLPIILLNHWLVSMASWLDNVPIVPLAILVVTSIATVWSASYVYLLYRKVVDDDAKPA
ncbi:hypothetical protein RAAC3_TM7C00001G0017 [Candidatus Saccharibacteria bacterium RAAC3_TM7_1]|nr:hypothetical protein RAAC3_TM7C00001G0017 [Candidatus Saccharibacteria bacterium RAAC3_TM7_1]HCZ28809.1 hypothetical protein [Candidatus Saccharibacteria bacterium]